MLKSLCLSAFCLLATQSALAADTVPFATGEWEPFTSKAMPNKGIATEFVTEICKEAGITPTFEFFPWPRAEKMVVDGAAFAAFPYAATPERTNNKAHLISDSIFDSQSVVFYHKGNPKFSSGVPKFETLSDLKAYKFGGVRGTFFEKDFESQKIPFEPTSDLDGSLQKLKSGRVDFVIEEPTVTFSQIQKLFPKEVEDFKTLSKPYGKKSGNVLIVSKAYKGSEALLKKFNAGLAKFKANGGYDKLIAKYKMAK